MRDEHTFSVMLDELRAIEEKLMACGKIDKDNDSHWFAGYWAVRSVREHLQKWGEEEKS